MAMEKQYVVRDTHTRIITAIGLHPVRREIFMGCEDGMIKMWEVDGGKLVQQSAEHKGWVTDFIFWSEVKLMLSSSNDGQILVWGPGGGLFDRIKMGVPIYCMAFNIDAERERHQLLCGVNCSIRIYELDDERDCGHVINSKPVFIASHHTDIVRCLVCHESKVYSAGYDQMLCVYETYESSETGEKGLKLTSSRKAHDAGISCLMLVKDSENQTWIITGSFDKTVKIWPTEGKRTHQHKLEGFLGTISGLCYVPKNKTIWVSGGTSYASLFDPKSGENVSDFIGTFQTQEEEQYTLQIMKYFPEFNQVVASTSRRHLIVWKYNTSGCITALKCKSHIETLTYTRKIPILIFSGNNEGTITKWERMQSNHFMFSKEAFMLSDAKNKKKKNHTVEDSNGSMDNNNPGKNEVKTENKFNHRNVRKPEYVSQYSFRKKSSENKMEDRHQNKTITRSVFVEELDVLVAACEDSNIYVWGFDDKAVDVFKSTEPSDITLLVKKYAILLSPQSQLLPDNQTKHDDDKSVTNRVAGFICKHILTEHFSCVTSLLVLGKQQGLQKTYLLSAGWDSRICIWDLEKGRLHDMFRNTSKLAFSQDQAELACDGIIIDMAYNPKSKEFAYASSDKMVYIRRFSLSGNEMVLLNTLQGHEGEITCIRWNDIIEKWVTGSEDGTIRIWSGSKLNECEQILAAQGTIHSMCIDSDNGAIVAGIQDTIKVYDPEEFHIVQTNIGHTDIIKSIIHIPERSQYVSGSWDETIRIWNSWRNTKKAKKSKQNGKKRDTFSSFKAEIEEGLKSRVEVDEDMTSEQTSESSAPVA